MQAGPVEQVYFPSDQTTGWHKCYGFVEFEHQESVLYSIQLLNGICLNGRPLKVRTTGKNGSTSGLVPLTNSKSTPAIIPNEAQHGAEHPTLGKRLAPLKSNGMIPPLIPPLLNEAQHQHRTSGGERLLMPSNDIPLNFPSEAQHPTLDQRLSSGSINMPYTPFDPQHHLGQRLSPLVTNNVPPLSIQHSNATNPTPLFDSNHFRNQNHTFGLPPPPFPHLSSPLPPCLPSPPLPPYNREVVEKNTINDLPEPPPLFTPAVNGQITDNNTGNFIDSQPISSSSANPQDQFHENRLVYLEDKPSWVTKETKEQIRDYHLMQLGQTLKKYKELLHNRNK